MVEAMTTTAQHGQCPVCRRKIALNRQGLLRAHIVPIVVNCPDPGNGRLHQRMDYSHRCEGSHGTPGVKKP